MSLLFLFLTEKPKIAWDKIPIFRLFLFSGMLVALCKFTRKFTPIFILFLEFGENFSTKAKKNPIFVQDNLSFYKFSLENSAHQDCRISLIFHLPAYMRVLRTATCAEIRWKISCLPKEKPFGVKE